MDIKTPATHRNDPDTSHEAEQAINASGKRSHQQCLVLQIVREYPGLTTKEMERASGYDRAMIARRMGELETAGDVEKGIRRKCNVNKTNAYTYWPTKKGAGNAE